MAKFKDYGFWLGYRSVPAVCILALMRISDAFAADVTLEWDQVSDPAVDHYEVFWGSLSGSYSESLNVNDPPANLTGLAAGQKYYLAVRACTANDTECSAFSNEIAVTTSDPIPEPPPAPSADFSASVYSGKSPLEVTFTPTSTVEPDALEALLIYEFDDGTPTDGSGSGNNGVLVGDPSYDSNTPDGSGYSMRFDGVNDILNAGKIDVAGTGLTLAAWIKADNFSADPRVISKATGSAANEHLWMLSTTNSGGNERLRARVRVGGSTTTLIASSGNLSTNTWHHVALSYDGQTLRLFLDGQQVGSTALAGAVDVDSSVSVAIGSNPGASYGLFDGLIDDVHIMEIALDSAEIAALVDGSYSAGSSPNGIDSYFWSFGDGATSDAESPTHIYSTPGSYTVSLTTTGPGGSAQQILEDAIQVTDSGNPGDPGDPGDPVAPVASFSAEITSGIAPLEVQFSNTSTDATAYAWNFGDGNTGNSAAPKHIYSTPGSYSVSLTATGEGGTSTDFKGSYITVTSPELDAQFTTNVTSGIAPLSVEFTSLSSGPVSSYSWDFGDGQVSSAANPVHIYQEPGTYTVSLLILGPDGEDVETKIGYVVVADSVASSLQIEAGEASVTHQWKTVVLEKEFENPVVFANLMSLKGSNEAVVQVKDVTSNSFAMRVHEWDFLDGSHTTETVGFAVVEAGRHQLPDGGWMEAGTIDLDSSNTSFAVGFEEAFVVDPVVISTVATDNDPVGTAVTTRISNVDSYGFEIRLQKEEGLPQEHANETVNYLAWQPSVGEIAGHAYEVGRTARVVNHKNYEIKFSAGFDGAPVALADMQTMNGRDTANLRWATKTGSQVTVLVDEERSADDETRHTKEVVGFLVLREVDSESVDSEPADSKPVDTAPLVTYTFDEGPGSSLALDASDEGNDGVLVGGPTYEADTMDGSAFSLRFDGVDDVVDVGSVDVNGSGLTLAARFKADTFPGEFRDPRIISKATGSAESDNVFMLSTIKVENDTRLRARVSTQGSTATLIASSGNLDVGKWYHAAVTYDGAVILLYLDGIQVGSLSKSGSVDIEPSVTVAIGGLPAIYSRYFDGLIDDVQILSRSLTSSEVSELAGVR